MEKEKEEQRALKDKYFVVTAQFIVDDLDYSKIDSKEFNVDDYIVDNPLISNRQFIMTRVEGIYYLFIFRFFEFLFLF